MDYSTEIKLAETYLTSKMIGFVKPPVEVIDLQNGFIEVVFLRSDAINPNVAVADPPDERVLVNMKTNEVSLIYQM